MAGLINCSDPSPTTNEVQPIDVAALDAIITDGTFRGLVVAMASWCPPCRAELPILAKLYDNYRDKGIQIVAFSVDAEGPHAVQPLINNLRVQFPVYWVGTRAAQHYRIAGVPMTMIYNNGRLVERLPGSHPKRVIEKKIKALVAAKN
jgi:thiol-disulfide isomerase/thioredoxin